MVRFTATVQLRGVHTFVDVPTTAVAELLPLAEHGRIRVTGKLRGTEFNATVMPGKSGRHVLYLSGGLRTATGVRVGETVTVDVLALNANEFIPPGDLAAALDAAVGAPDKWEQLPVSHRRELTRFLEDARTPSTRRTVETIGPVTLVRYRDRVAFTVRVRFAGVKPASKWLDVDLWLTRRVESPRFRRVETLSPYTHLYTVRVTEASEVDDELASWLREAYAVGHHEHLRSPEP